MHVPRHTFDADRARRTWAVYDESLRWKLERVPGRADLLGSLTGDALTQAGIVAALEPDSPEIGRLLRLAARAGVALFALSRAEGRALEMPLDGEAPQRLVGRGDESQLHAGRWLDAFWAATATGDAAAQAVLAVVPTDILRASSSQGDPYLYLLVEAVQAYAARDQDAASERLLGALRATDPAGLQYASVDRVLDLDVPLIEVMFGLFDGEAPALDTALQKALGLHGRYWGSDDRRDDPDGFLSTALAGIVAWAQEIGLVLGTTSDYLPRRAPTDMDGTLVLCPYCLLPLAAAGGRCAACLGDSTRDAPVEIERRELRAAPRKPCVGCGRRLLSRAIVCATCRARQ